MGKRSDGDFPRIERDFYATPAKAVLPLIPYLRRDGITTFAEPCCGEGDLIRHLESYGLVCVASGDIVTGQDALKLTTADCNGAQAIITNTPYKHPEDRKGNRLARDLIRHFLSLDPALPFWIPIPHDWTTNVNLARIMMRCSDLVVIGRVKWITGSKSGGKDNFVWARFDVRHRGKTCFHNDRGIRADVSRQKQASGFCWYDTGRDEYAG